jgi:hypothetical protein
MDGTGSTHDKDEKSILNFSRKPRRDHLGERKWEDNIKMDIK